ncbi:MAG: POTRA domain-containing protein, partial [bacterium]
MNIIIKTFALTILVLFGVTWSELLPQNRNSLKVKLDQLQVVGSKKISNHEIRNWFKFREGDFVSEQDVRQRCSEVLQRFSERGYYFAKFNTVNFNYSKDSSRVDVTLRVDEGDQLIINEITIKGLAEADKKILKDLETQAGQVFYQQTLQDDIDYLI